MHISSKILSVLVSLALVACLPPPKRPEPLGKKGEGNLQPTGTQPNEEGGAGIGGSSGTDGSPNGGVSGDGGAGTSGAGGTGSGDGGGAGGGGMGTGAGGGGTGGTGTGDDGGGTGSGGGGTGNAPPALQTVPRFDELVWLTSHNSFVNDEDEKWLVVNQSRSTQFQLDNGVNAFMLDLHLNDGKAALCHGKCDSNLPFPTVQRTMDLEKNLALYKAHLDKHKASFITLILEDYLDNSEDLKRALSSTKLLDYIFDPYKWDVKNKGWPRIDALKKENKRLFIISSKSNKKGLGVAFAPDFTNENYWSIGDKGTDLVCKSRWDKVPLNRKDEVGKFRYLFVMNHFRNIPLSGNSRSDNTTGFLWRRINEFCLPSAQEKPAFVAVDHFDEADWGARKVVEELRENGVIVFKDAKLAGPMRMFKEGRYTAKDIPFGDNQVDSIKVNAGFRVKIYDDGDFKNLIGEFTEDVLDLGDKINKTSSVIVEKK